MDVPSKLMLQISYDCFFEEETDNIINYILSLRNNTIGTLLARKRTHVPRLTGFAENIVPLFNTQLFRSHFRVTPEIFDVIIHEIHGDLLSAHGGGTEQVDPNKQLLVFLAYMANQESMREVGLQFGIGIATVYNIVHSLSSTINAHLLNVINWPNIQAQQEEAHKFQAQSGISGIVGALDGSHIRLLSAPKGDRDYYNRKHYPSMQLQIPWVALIKDHGTISKGFISGKAWGDKAQDNLTVTMCGATMQQSLHAEHTMFQVVCDSSLLIRHAYTGWPGCTHDARVLRNSSLFQEAENGQLIGQGNQIIADSAYPLRNWLITPFRDNGRLTRRQRQFNQRLSSARQVVERTFGHLKGRFRRLREITFHTPDQIASVIITGCILHNLCILHHEEIDEFIEEHDDHPNRFPNIYLDGGCGTAKRLQLMNTMV